MKALYLLFTTLSLSFLVLETYAQDSTQIQFRKIDLNVNFNVNGKTNFSEGSYDGPKSVQAILTFYPLQFRKTQMGFSLGIEKIEVRSSDSLTTTETRIPILATAKINLSKQQAVYLRTQIGTALTTSSFLTIDEIREYNYRDDIGAPIIMNIGLGINLPFYQVGVGVEMGFSYKQLSYKRINDYQSGAFYLGLSISFP